VLAFMDCPKEHRAKIHSTHVLERLNGEVKRRADVVGIFPNENAITRLVGVILLEQNDEYAIQKRYMSLESLATMSENPPIRLPADRRDLIEATKRKPGRFMPRFYTTRRDITVSDWYWAPQTAFHFPISQA